jgi:DNA polymerase III delta prime subunit
MKWLLNQQTRANIDAYAHNPAHAVLLIGDVGAGVHMARDYMTHHIKESHTEQIVVSIVEPEKKSITIEQIRSLRDIIKHKQGDRLFYIVIAQAHTMTREAQNSFLKQLEEPVSGVHYILEADGGGLLETIQSRCHIVRVLPVRQDEAFAYSKGEASDTNYVISGGLAGVYAELEGESSGEFLALLKQAKHIVTSSPYERLIAFDALAKEKKQTLQVLDALLKTCQAALRKTQGSKRWRHNCEVLLQAHTYANANVQSKLIYDFVAVSLA